MDDAYMVGLTPELAAAVTAAAAWRHMSLERYVHEVVATATRLDAQLAADVKEGEDDLAAGRFHTQEEVEAMFNVRRDQRRAA